MQGIRERELHKFGWRDEFVQQHEGWGDGLGSGMDMRMVPGSSEHMGEQHDGLPFAIA